MLRFVNEGGGRFAFYEDFDRCGSAEIVKSGNVSEIVSAETDGKYEEFFFRSVLRAAAEGVFLVRTRLDRFAVYGLTMKDGCYQAEPHKIVFTKECDN